MHPRCKILKCLKDIEYFEYKILNSPSGDAPFKQNIAFHIGLHWTLWGQNKWRFDRMERPGKNTRAVKYYLNIALFTVYMIFFVSKVKNVPLTVQVERRKKS